MICPRCGYEYVPLLKQHIKREKRLKKITEYLEQKTVLSSGKLYVFLAGKGVYGGYKTFQRDVKLLEERKVLFLSVEQNGVYGGRTTVIRLLDKEV